MTPVARLRHHTAAAHDRVYAVFGTHDLTDRASYATFLRAHARALPAVEAVLAGHADLPAWRRRTDLLAADLADLGESLPTPLPFALPGTAAAWGALYVSEGSRLGGAILARGVPATLPGRYLGAKHLSGEWRSLLTAIDAAGETGGEAWIAEAIAGAEATFTLYARAV